MVISVSFHSVGTNGFRVRAENERVGSREIKHATFLSHGRKPEVNILLARTLVSQIFKVIVSTSAKRLKNINVIV